MFVAMLMIGIFKSALKSKVQVQKKLHILKKIFQPTNVFLEGSLACSSYSVTRICFFSNESLSDFNEFKFLGGGKTARHFG